MKSVGLCPRRFESCRLRFFFSLTFWLFSTLVFFILHTHAVQERKTRSKPELCYTTTLGAVKGVASYRGVKLQCKLTVVVVAEWLRRQTRNLLGSARAGSNPADYAFFSPSLFVCLPYFCNLYTLFLLLHPLFKISSFSFNLPLPPNPCHCYAGFLSPVLCCTCALLLSSRERGKVRA